MSLSRRTRARIAWLRSFLKRKYAFNDYPVDYVDQGEQAPTLRSRDYHRRWRADLLGSHVAGLGDSPEEALADAREKFVNCEARGENMSRPGSTPKVAFASDEIVSCFPELQEHFIANIFVLPWAIITDESSLWDFHGELDNSTLLEKIWDVYAVDVSHISDGNIGAIFTFLVEEMRDFPEDEINKIIRMGRDERDRRAAAMPGPPWVQRSDQESYETAFRPSKPK